MFARGTPVCAWLAQGQAAKMKLKIPDGAFLAYLFDCDGTIADSMPLHYVARRSALAEWNCDFPEDLFYAWGGFPVTEIISRLNEKQGLKMSVPDVARRKEELYFDALPHLKAVPEVFIGNGDGTLQSGVLSSISDIANLGAVGDFDGDGELDLVGTILTSPTNGQLELSFFSRQRRWHVYVSCYYSSYRTPLTTGQILGADLDGDGKLDLITIQNQSANTPPNSFTITL
jgi:hypothetical protein